MNYGTSSLLLGLLIIPVTSSFPPGSCDGYTNITEPWRNRAFVTSFYPKDDGNLLNSWWRFTGIGGDRVITDCVSPYLGGTWHSIYITFMHPTNESVTPTTGTAYAYYYYCDALSYKVSIALCPGGFYVYKPLSHPFLYSGYVTYHYNCQPDSCGPLAMCDPAGGCVCVPGMEIPSGYLPSPDAYGCVDIDECQRTQGICGSYSNCTNTVGSYICTCLQGFSATSSSLPVSLSNQCKDINECLTTDCGNGTCYNNPGSYVCSCYQGYLLVANATPVCQDINECLISNVCGPNSVCTNMPGTYSCACQPGYGPNIFSICTDINECLSSTVCGPNSVCTNMPGTYSCACQSGYTPPQSDAAPSESNSCTDINECLISNVCGSNSVCTNMPGTYSCACQPGYGPNIFSNCTDIDECLSSTVCGPNSVCTNMPGTYSCACQSGYTPPQSDAAPSESNICTDINECLISDVCGPNSVCTNMPGTYSCACQPGYGPNSFSICTDIDECLSSTVCGPNSVCTNMPGTYSCACQSGYTPPQSNAAPSESNICTDIDECSEYPDICGTQSVCNNVPGNFYCSCPNGFYPSTGVAWVMGVTCCQNLIDVIKAKVPPKGKTEERAFLDSLAEELKNNPSSVLPDAMVANLLSACMEVAGVSPLSGSVNVSSEGDGETGSVILGIVDLLVSEMLSLPYHKTTKRLQTSVVDLSLEAIGPGDDDDSTLILYSKGNIMEINLHGPAKANNGSAAVFFMSMRGMEILLSHQYFKTASNTEMYSDILTAVLLPLNNAILTKPVNFTILHKYLNESGTVTCVYWKDTAMEWSVDGCWITYSDENYTVCSCSHLSTFALILQIGEPPPDNPFIDWLNRVCVIIGLFFFALAILTFLLCSWNPKINNTARLHLCINLALSQLLLLWDDKYVNDKLACKVMAGLLHFLVVASFVWMLLEALQLYLLVRSLSKVQVIQRDGLPRLLLCLIGYGVPFAIVGVSALVYSDGYGATDAQVCWLSTQRNFNWASTGPVIAILAFNLTLFCATLWSLRPTLANMKSDISQSKDTRLIVFKIVAQFVILGCPWIIGLYQTNLFFQVVFIVLNSQQGTLLYIVHCFLNKEVREEYKKWLTWSFRKDHPVKDTISLSEDLGKPEEKTNERKKNYE